MNAKRALVIIIFYCYKIRLHYNHYQKYYIAIHNYYILKKDLISEYLFIKDAYIFQSRLNH